MAAKIKIQESHRSVVVPREPSLSRKLAHTVVTMAQRFRSDILLTAGSIHIDAKSMLMAFFLIDALKGQEVVVQARGQDAALAIHDLTALFLSAAKR
jgi:phosphotransferase system HPr (HPr) family protein